jgi:hypothetical protein
LSDSPRGINASPASPAGGGWLTLVATVTGNLYLVMATFILSFIGIAVSWLPPRGSWMSAIMRIWSNGLLAASMVRVEASYDPGLEPGRSYIFLSNHQSLYDIPVLLATCPGQVRMMAKRGLFQIPVFGWGLRASSSGSTGRTVARPPGVSPRPRHGCARAPRSSCFPRAPAR